MSTSQELYNQAEKLKDEGKHEEAITILNQIIEQEEGFVLAHLALAVLYGRVNKHDDAVRHGERACELEPTEPFNFTAISVTYQRAYAGTGDQKFIQMAEDAKARSDMMHHG